MCNEVNEPMCEGAGHSVQCERACRSIPTATRVLITPVLCKDEVPRTLHEDRPMTNLRRRHWLAVASGALLLSACGGNGGSSGGMPSPIPLPGNSPTVDVDPVFTGITLANPVAMLQAPGDNGRWFVVEQAGRVRVFNNDPAVSSASNFIDITSQVNFQGETGLLGMAFHPNFPVDPRVFLFYSHNDASAGLVSRLSRFLTADGGRTLDPASEQILLVIDKPEDNHNGGGIGFGRDGFLYLGIGDGGGANDQHGSIGNAQSLTTLLGKMLRIDIDFGAGAFLYSIPFGNPFAGNTPCGANGTGTANCPEIFALGFRNPWRWSFDRSTGDLWVGDVGQNAREEVDLVVAGGNYGWRCMEGTRDTGLGCGTATNFLPPIADYGRDVGTTVTGGYVYRGTQFPTLVGRYIFGDFGSGRIFNIANTTTPTVSVSGGFNSGISMSSFAEGNDGELYVVGYDGRLFHITN
jgi:glucose/arabinose dehydrogenase